jgi:hypothetical protein
MKKLVLFIISVSLYGCGPSACECAKLKDKNTFIIYANDAPSEAKKTKRKIEECAEKYDGLNNAEKECNENPE